MTRPPERFETAANRLHAAASRLSRRREFRPSVERIKEAYRAPGELRLGSVGIEHARTVPSVDQSGPFNNDGTMGKATAEFEERDVAGTRRPLDLARVSHHTHEIPLGIAMEVPVGRIERDFDMWNDAGRLVNLGEHHQATGAGTFEPAHVVIGCA